MKKPHVLIATLFATAVITYSTLPLAQAADHPSIQIAADSDTASGQPGTSAPATTNEKPGAMNNGASGYPTAGAKGSSSEGGSDSMSSSHKGMRMGKKMGTHSMSGTVDDIDSETGIVDLKTDVGVLKLHFPPKSLANVKKGDKLKVSLGFAVEK